MRDVVCTSLSHPSSWPISDPASEERLWSLFSSPCVDRLIRDWSADGALDRPYPLRCYPAAIARLPIDLRDYSDASSSIAEAWATERAAQRDRRRPAAAARPEPVVTATPKPTIGVRAVTARPAVEGGSAQRDAHMTASVVPPATTVGGRSLPLPLLGLAALTAAVLCAGAVTAGVSRLRRD